MKFIAYDYSKTFHNGAVNHIAYYIALSVGLQKQHITLLVNIKQYV